MEKPRSSDHNSEKLSSGDSRLERELANILGSPLSDSELTKACMNLSERSLADVRDNENDKEWKKYL